MNYKTLLVKTYEDVKSDCEREFLISTPRPHYVGGGSSETPSPAQYYNMTQTSRSTTFEGGRAIGFTFGPPRENLMENARLHSAAKGDAKAELIKNALDAKNKSPGPGTYDLKPLVPAETGTLIYHGKSIVRGVGNDALEYDLGL